VGVLPAICLVIKDTATGLYACLAAGATVWGYCPGGYGLAFEELPVVRVFRHTDALVA
jgi:beta-phosphoglucomutase-like phosphatase (HAD superfamily)